MSTNSNYNSPPLNNVIHNREPIALQINQINTCVPSKNLVGTVGHRTGENYG
jgi:hypothetical protein